MLILMLEICTVNSHSQGTCVLLEIPSMHKLIQYFQSLYTCRKGYIDKTKQDNVSVADTANVAFNLNSRI